MDMNQVSPFLQELFSRDKWNREATLDGDGTSEEGRLRGEVEEAVGAQARVEPCDDPFGEQTPIPTKLGLQYYFYPTYNRIHRQLYIGTYLKAHLSNADFVEVGLGYTF